MSEKRKNIDMDALRNVITATADQQRAQREVQAAKWARRILSAIASGRCRFDAAGYVHVTLFSFTSPEGCARELGQRLRTAGFETPVYWINDIHITPFKRVFRLGIPQP